MPNTEQIQNVQRRLESLEQRLKQVQADWVQKSKTFGIFSTVFLESDKRNAENTALLERVAKAIGSVRQVSLPKFLSGATTFDRIMADMDSHQRTLESIIPASEAWSATNGVKTTIKETAEEISQGSSALGAAVIPVVITVLVLIIVIKVI